MALCECGCGMSVRVGRRFLQGHATRVGPRGPAIPQPSREGQGRGQWPTRNALLIDKPALRPSMRSLALRGGTKRPGRLYWYGEYPAKNQAAKEQAYHEARERAEGARLLIVEERVE